MGLSNSFGSAKRVFPLFAAVIGIVGCTVVLAGCNKPDDETTTAPTADPNKPVVAPPGGAPSAAGQMKASQGGLPPPPGFVPPK